MFNRRIFLVFVASLSSLSSASTIHFKGHAFESYIIRNNWYRFPEIVKNGTSCLQVHEGEEYSIVINNPLPVRVAVAITIDGLNSMDGKLTSPDKARKWMIEPYSSITLRGWQTDRSSIRRFIFTDKSESYAKWKERRDHKNYTKNLGVIGVAYFWNSHELDAALNPPVPFINRKDDCIQEESMSAPAAGSGYRAEKKAKAGTGMGRQESNVVVDVEFNYNTGMYHGADALTIYYEFAENDPQPKPFIDDEYSGEFVPDMYK